MRLQPFGRTGLAVSEIGLGTRLFGTGVDLDDCRRVLAVYEDAGGNILDTAVTYGDGRSEEALGDLLAGGRRDRFVVSTKFGLRRDPQDANSAGASRRNLRRSLDESLQRLRTDHVDVLWLHAWYPGLCAQELLRAVRDEITRGRVLALGLSNAPAWLVAKAQTIAEIRGWDSLCGVQVEYSLLDRSAEVDVLPMAQELRLTVVGWSPLARGRLLRAPITDPDGGARPSRASLQAALSTVSSALDRPRAAVAVGWALHQGVVPLVGARAADQLTEILRWAGKPLPAEHLDQLDCESAAPPHGLAALLHATRPRVDPSYPQAALPGLGAPQFTSPNGKEAT